MFGKSIYQGIPYIADVAYLDHYNLFVTFENGEQRIFDASQVMNSSPRSRLFYPIDEFKKFKFDRTKLYWGDENKHTDHQVFRDSIYDFSFPFFAIVSSSGMIVSLSMARVTEMSPFPVKNLENTVQVFVHGKDADRHKLPHVHINFHTSNEPFKLDGTPILALPNPPYSGKILKAIRAWISANLNHIADEWNKENPDNPIDPKTGEYIKK